MHKIISEFANALEKNKSRAMEMFQMFKKLFQLRGLRATALIANSREFVKLFELEKNSAGALEKLSSKLAGSWGMAAKATGAALSKIRHLLVEIFGAPIIGEIAKGVKNNILKPLLDNLTDEAYWTSLRDAVAERVGTTFDDITKKAGKLLQLIFIPEKAFGLERGTQAYRDALNEAFNEVLDDLKPIGGLLADMFRGFGKLAGEGFISAFVEGIFAKIPGIRQLTTTGQEKEMMIRKFQRTFKQARPSATEDYPEAYDEAKRLFWQEAYEMQEGAREVTRASGGWLDSIKALGYKMKKQINEFEKVSAVEKWPEKLAGLVAGAQPAKRYRGSGTPLGSEIWTDPKTGVATNIPQGDWEQGLGRTRKLEDVLFKVGQAVFSDLESAVSEAQTLGTNLVAFTDTFRTVIGQAGSDIGEAQENLQKALKEWNDQFSKSKGAPSLHGR
jgi:hypothetical protein